MAQVPYSGAVPEVKPEVQTPDRYERVQSSANNFGGLVAEGMQKFGEGASAAGHFFGQVAADHASNEYQANVDKLLYGDPNNLVQGPDGNMRPSGGFLTLDKEAAIQAWPAVAKQLDELRTSTRSQLTSPEQQYQFDTVSRRYKSFALSQVGRHADAAYKGWYNDVEKSTADLAISHIGYNAYDDDAFRQSEQELINARIKTAQRAGAVPGDSVWDATVQGAKQDALKARLETIAVKNPSQAAAMVDQNKEQLGRLYAPLSTEFRARAKAANGMAKASQYDQEARAAASGLTPGVPPSTGTPITGMATVYSPSTTGNKMEGGLVDARDRPITTIEDWVANGRQGAVTGAGAAAYLGRHYVIPSITYLGKDGQQHTETNVPYAVTDTGGAFAGAPEGRFDIPVRRDMTDAEMAAQPFSSKQLTFIPAVPPGAAGTKPGQVGQADNIGPFRDASGQSPVVSVSPKANMNGVHPALSSSITAAAKDFPYDVRIISGLRPAQGERFHKDGRAIDVGLFDKTTGKMIPNYQNAESFSAYEQFAQRVRQAQMEQHPELGSMFRWGGYFSGPPGKYGAMDLMHFDLGASDNVGMAGGSWDKGLTPEQKALFPGAESRGQGAPLGAAARAAVPTSVKQDAFQRLQNDPDLQRDPEAMEAAVSHLQRIYSGRSLAQEQDRVQKRDANDKAANGYVTRMLTGNTAGVLEAIAADPDLTWEVKKGLGEAVEAHAGDDVRKASNDYGPGFWTAYKQATLPYGDPHKIADVGTLLSRAGPGGDLTLAGVQKLTNVIEEGRKGVDGAALNTAKVGALNAAKKYLSFDQEFTFPGLPPMRDLAGERIFSGTFIPLFEQGFETWVKEGKDPYQYLDPKNIDKMAQALRPSKDIAAARIAAGAEVSGQATGAAAPASTQTIPVAPAGFDPVGWATIVSKPPKTDDGAVWKPADWSKVVERLAANPSPEMIKIFDASKFGRAGYRAADILQRLAPRTAAPAGAMDDLAKKYAP